MTLVFYLQIEEDGRFLFSDTLEFEVNKSSGIIEKTETGYVMAYDSINNEPVSISEGKTSNFIVTEDNELDFSGSEKLYYGTASIVSQSDENSTAKLVAKELTNDFEPSTKEVTFTYGSYEASGENINYTVSFYEDNSYIVAMKQKTHIH